MKKLLVLVACAMVSAPVLAKAAELSKKEADNLIRNAVMKGAGPYMLQVFTGEKVVAPLTSAGGFVSSMPYQGKGKSYSPNDRLGWGDYQALAGAGILELKNLNQPLSGFHGDAGFYKVSLTEKGRSISKVNRNESNNMVVVDIRFCDQTFEIDSIKNDKKQNAAFVVWKYKLVNPTPAFKALGWDANFSKKYLTIFVPVNKGWVNYITKETR